MSNHILGTFDVGEKHDAVSCTRIRSSIATDIACVGEEDLETVATAFFKHRKATCEKYYVHHFKVNEGL